MNYYIEAFRRYTDFIGRSSRSEYWYFILFNFITGLILGLVDIATGSYNFETGYGLLSGLYLLIIILPALAVAVRRLHDTSRSGWFLLIPLIPIVGSIVLIILFATASDNKKNAYGPVPKKLVVVRR